MIKSRIKTVSFLGLIIISGLIMVFASQVYAGSNKTFSIGWESWEPYQYEDENKQLTGLEIELVKAIIKNMSCEIKFKEMPWDRQLNELKHGDTDLAAGASKTPEREEFAYFSDPYRTESAVMYIRKGETSKYKFSTLEDIIGSGFRLGVTKGYFYGENYDKLIKNPKFKEHVEEVSNDSKNFKKLMSNRIDGFLVDKIAGPARLLRENILDKVEVHPVPIYSSDIFIMFSKKSTKSDDVEAFNKSLKELKANGSYNAIFGKYLK